MGKKFNTVSVCLILVLGFRFMANAEPVLTSGNSGPVIVFLLYLVPLIGVVLRRRWGPVMSGVVGVLDAAMTLAYIRGVNVIGPVLVDIVLVLLSGMDYRQLVKKLPSPEKPAEPALDKAQQDRE